MDGSVARLGWPGRALLAASALLAAGALAGPARADSFRIFADGHGHIGNPSAGGLHQTSATALSGSGTLFGTGGSAPYSVAAGPGVARSALSGGFTNPFLLTVPFAPVAHADATTTLTVTGPPGQLATSLNLRLDGTVRHVCETGFMACETRISIVADLPGQSLFTDANTSSGVTRNTLGLTLTPIADGFRLHGDVTTPPFLVTANTPFDVRLRVMIEVGVSGAGFEASTTWNNDFGDGLSFAPAGPVLNLPPGYDAVGSSVVGNRWRDPFAPAPADDVAPAVTGVPARPPDANGWYRAPVAIDWQAVDPEPSSGPPSDPPDTLAATEGRDVLYESGPSCDPAGNCSVGTVVVSLDRTPPTITCDAPAPPVFAAGSSDLGDVVSASVTDELSGSLIAGLADTPDTSSLGEKTVVFTASDLAGNEATQACPYLVVDRTPPLVTGVPARAPDANGWYRAPVAIDWQAVDPEPSSGLPSDPPDTIAATEGRDVVYESGPSCDPAGNCGTGTLTLSIDATPPTVTCETPAPVFLLGELALVQATVADGLSGVASEEAHFADTSTVGEKTALLTASDFAGNETAQACPYRVEYGFSGFVAPVENPPDVNVVTAGRTVVLQWRLTDASGAPVTELAGATLSTVTRDCELGTAGNDEATEATAGSSGLQSLGDGWYQLNWETPRDYARSCKTLRLDLGEGAFRTALFRFR